MTKNTFRLVAVCAAFALVALVALVGMMGLNAVAGSGGKGQSAGFLQHLHSMGQQLHHGGHHQQHGHHQHMARLIEQLDLTPGQQQHLEKIHEILAAHTGGAGEEPTSMAEIHHQMITRVAQGELDADGVRALIDGHLAEMRSLAYAVTDELVALIDGLDSGQREILQQHLQGNHEGHEGP